MNKSLLCAFALSATLATTAARAHGPTLSDASALSLLPVAVSVTAPVMMFSAGAVLTVVAVEASTVGTVWVLERASDGARASVLWAGHAVGAASVAIGSAIVVSAVGTGHVLSAAGHALAFIPNEIGAALLYNERITR